MEPGVADGSGLAAISFHCARPPRFRWDAAPFTAMYWTVILTSIFNWWTKHPNAWSFKHKLMLTVLLNVLAVLSSYWSVRVRLVTQFFRAPRWKGATHVKVAPASHLEKKEIVPLQTRVLGEGSEAERVTGFEYRKQWFVYDSEAHIFAKLKYPVEETFEHYATSSGYSQPDKIVAATERWGPNRFDVPQPQFAPLLMEQLLAPFFCFQVFCVGLWALDEYWYYSLFTLGMLVMFECTVVMQRMRNLRELRSLQTPKQQMLVHRGGKWVKLPGEALLPGDLVSIGRPHGGAGQEERVVPADMLLLAGTCIVEEAVLTGESTPQWKRPVSGSAAEDGNGALSAGTGLGPEARLLIKRDKAHLLFGGTRVLQHTGDKDARIRTQDNGCLAVVLRTGFETSQGQLMRTILYSTDRVTANNWETGLFIVFLLIFAVAASGYVLYYGLQDPDRDRFKLFLNCTMILTSVIPPELPMELSIAVNASLLALARKAVFCTEPFRIPLAGRVDVCCFDKTGTLTSDNMVLEGVAGLPGRGAELAADVHQAGPEAVRVLAACQSLIHVEGELVGDPLEKAAFGATGWTHAADTWSSPKGKTGSREAVTILHRLHFSSGLKRMSALVKVESDDSSQAGLWVLLKGAPEVVRPLLREAPPDFDQSYKRYAAQGARVIALAHRRLLTGTAPAEARGWPRARFEGDLRFAGFAVLQCPLKPESEPALRMLRDSSHQLVMITGDQPLTACHAAARVHITDRRVLMLTHRGQAAPPSLQGDAVEADTMFCWATPDESVELPFDRSAPAAIQLAQSWDLCLTGDALAHLQHVGAEAVWIPLTQVFARVAPDQKELILRTLRAAGWTTLMCGDGTNDVGALKAAHVGVALLAPSAARAQQAQRGARPGQAPGPPQMGLAAVKGAAAAPAGAGRGALQAAGAGASSAAAANGGDKPPGAGSRMLEEYRKKGRPITPKLEQLAKMLDGLDAGDDGQVAMVKPGDASMASPFTAKRGNVAPCCDILKQGRSTLVTTVQMFKILGLLCLSTAYSLSVMYLQGIKLGDMQATTQGFLSAGLFFVVSNATPLPELSRQRPHPHIFCSYVFLSVLGQFAVHLGYLVSMYYGALRLMPRDHAQAPDGDFKPNLVNTVCYVVQFVIQLSTFAVNYQGHPFNTSITQTKGFFNMLKYAYAFTLAIVYNLFGLGTWFSLVPIPEPLRTGMVLLGLLDLALTLGLEQTLRHLFPAAIPPQKGYEAWDQLSKRRKQLQHRKQPALPAATR